MKCWLLAASIKILARVGYKVYTGAVVVPTLRMLLCLQWLLHRQYFYTRAFTHFLLGSRFMDIV